MATELQRLSVTDAVVNYFRQKIRSGELKPGQRLPSERQLVKELGVSRFSLREGFARLSALGLIETHQGKGAFLCEEINRNTLFDVMIPMIANEDTKPFKDMIEARSLLECASASKAAERRSRAELDALEAIVEESASALHDPQRFAALDFSFHQLIATMADNSFFGHMQEILYRGVFEFIHQNVKEYKTREDALQDHREILQSIRAGDGARAGASMERHITLCVHQHSRKQRGEDQVHSE